MIRIGANPHDDSGVKTTAFMRPDGSEFSFVCTNTGGSRSVAFILEGINAKSLKVWRTSSSEDCRRLADVPVSGASFTHELPGESVTSFMGPAGALSLDYLSVTTGPNATWLGHIPVERRRTAAGQPVVVVSGLLRGGSLGVPDAATVEMYDLTGARLTSHPGRAVDRKVLIVRGMGR
jgi:hypothetical protein